MKKIEFNRKFLFSLCLSVLVCIVFLLILMYAYNVLQNTITKNTEENAKILAISTINQIDAVLSVSQQIPEDLACVLEYGQIPNDRIKELLKNIVENSNEIYGSTISFEPYMFEKDRYFFGPYFFKPEGKIKFSDLGTQDYNYLNWEWYISPKTLNKGVWIDPYFDKGGEDISIVTYTKQQPILNFESTGGGRILMITYSEPFYKNIDGKRVFSGVVTCDIALSWLQKLVTDTKIFKLGYAFIVSNSGKYIVHKNKNYVLNENIFSLADKRKDSTLRKIGTNMTNGQSGFARYYSYTLGKRCFVYYSPLNTASWSLCVVIPEEEFLSDSSKDILKLFVIGFAGCALIIVSIVILGRYVSK